LRDVALAATMVVIMAGTIPVVTIAMGVMRLLLLLRVFITLRKRLAIRQDVIDKSALDNFTFNSTFSDTFSATFRASRRI